MVTSKLDNTAESHSTRTDQSGRFSTGYSPGETEIGVWNGTLWGVERIHPSEVGKDIDIIVRMKRGRTITGTVHLENGKRAPFAEVHFACDGVGIFDIVQADWEGRFEIGGLPYTPVHVFP